MSLAQNFNPKPAIQIAKLPMLLIYTLLRCLICLAVSDNRKREIHFHIARIGILIGKISASFAIPRESPGKFERADATELLNQAKRLR